MDTLLPVDARSAHGTTLEGGLFEPVRWVLPNGLKVLVAEDHSAPVVAVQVWVGTGSADELPHESGLAHVHEHMLFKGTSRRGVGEIAREIEGAGGDINAYTTKDSTVYHVVIASRFVDVALDVLADAVFHSAFDADELARELEVVHEEFRRGEDMPDRKIYELLFETAYLRHPYRTSTIGDPEVFTRLTRGDVETFFQKWYVPRNLTLVVTGDVDAEALRPRIDSLFGTAPDCAIPDRPRLPEPRPAGLRSRVARGPYKKTLLYLGFPAPSIREADVAAVDVMAAALGDGDSSRLWREVKERAELVHSIFTFAMTPRDRGLFVIGLELDPENLEDAVHATFEQLHEVRRAPLPQRELAKALGVIESDFVYEKESAQGAARALGFYESLADDWRFEGRYLESLRSVNAAQILEVAQRYLTLDQLSAVLLLPDDERTELDDAALARLLDQADAAVARTEQSSLQQDGDFLVERFSNGLELIVRQRPGVEVVSMSAVLLGGVRIEPPGKAGISSFVGSMLTRGTETRDAEDIARAVDEMAGSLDGFSGRNSFGARGHFQSKHFEEALELLAEVLMFPTFPEEEVEKERADVLHDLEAREDDLARLAFERMQADLYGDHPAANPTIGTVESVTAITADDLRAFHARHARPSNLVLAVVGNIDPERVRNAVHARLATWECEPHEAPTVPAVVPLSGVKHGFRAALDKQQTHVVLAFPGVRLDHPDRFTLEVMSTVLSGQGGRLFLELRDRQSLAYTVFSFTRDGLDPGYVGAYIATSPEKAIQGMNGLAAELRSLRDDGITEAELEWSKRNLVGTFEIALQSSSAQAEAFSLYESYGLGYREYLAYPERILAVTLADVSRVARTYLDAERMVLSIVGPDDVTHELRW